MGNYIPTKCENCSLEYGENPIFKIYHSGNLGGHILCSDCYNDKSLHDKLKNKLSNRCIKQKCSNCLFVNNYKESRKLLKIYWYGKFGDKILCDRCVFDKTYRKTRGATGVI